MVLFVCFLFVFVPACLQAQRDAPGSSCVFPAPLLESVQSSLVLFIVEQNYWRIVIGEYLLPLGRFILIWHLPLLYVDYVIFIARTFRPCSGLFWEAEAGPASHLEMSLPVSAERWEPLASLGAATERTAHALRRFTTVAQF